MALNLQDMISNQLLDELANRFTRELDADIILDAIAFPPAFKPKFETSIQFWLAVCQEIDRGRISGGFEALLGVAAGRLPANNKFKPYGQVGAADPSPINSAVNIQQPVALQAGLPEPATVQGAVSGAAGRKLRVFLCHSSADKPVVRELHQKLIADGFQPWLDEVDILPGQDWDLEIKRAVRHSDVVVVTLSQGSVDKIGYVQKEIKMVLDLADEQPEGAIFLIPLKLENCQVPDRLSRWQYVDYYTDPVAGYQRLLRALRQRTKDLKLS
jgi:TIR domain/Effector-associated domain 1